MGKTFPESSVASVLHPGGYFTKSPVILKILTKKKFKECAVMQKAILFLLEKFPAFLSFLLHSAVAPFIPQGFWSH